MAKQEVAKTTTNEVAPLNSFAQQFSQHFAELDKKENLRSLDAEYKDFTEGESFDCILHSIETNEIKGHEKECVSFYDKDGQRFISAATMLVKATEKVNLPCPARLNVKGKKSSTNGDYFVIEVLVPSQYYKSQKK